LWKIREISPEKNQAEEITDAAGLCNGFFNYFLGGDKQMLGGSRAIAMGLG